MSAPSSAVLDAKTTHDDRDDLICSFSPLARPLLFPLSLPKPTSNHRHGVELDAVVPGLPTQIEGCSEVRRFLLSLPTGGIGPGGKTPTCASSSSSTSAAPSAGTIPSIPPLCASAERTLGLRVSPPSF